MRYSILTAFLITLITVSCKKTELSDHSNPMVLDGIYSGTFQRTQDSKIARVTIIFSSADWMGESRVPNYPLLCKGRYEITGDNILFGIDCFWILEYDQSLILNGEYKIKITGNDIEIRKEYSDAFKTIDLYKLTKQY